MEKIDPKELFKRYWYVLALILIVWTAFWLRSFPARFGELQALDPFYFYRMGQDIIETGNLVEWDYMRYYPRGVDPYQIEYVGTTFGPVYVYLALSGIGVINMPFLYWAIIWPALLGALAVLAMYFIGKEMFGKKAGLFSAFFLATVPAFITRTSAGFYEKEPVAGLFIILSVYFFVRAFKRDSWISGILGGLSLAVVSLSWVGVQYIYLLFTGFMLFLFAMNAVFLVLDYLFKGFSDTLQRLDRWFGPRMIISSGISIAANVSPATAPE